MSFPLVDLALSRRLERAEASANARFVEERARVEPASGAAWIEVAGAYALFDTPSSPLTQTFGLGIFDTTTPADLDRIEGFFRERQAPVFHEVSPLAPDVLPLLSGRGYQPIELTSVMFRPLLDASPPPARAGRVHVRETGADEAELWARTGAEGWGETPELAAFVLEFGRVGARRDGGVAFLAEAEGRPVATGFLCLHEGVALLAGASTVPDARRQGAQRALLDARLGYARERGCDLAMMCAAPGSASQRNGERNQFRIAYTRIKWSLQPSGTTQVAADDKPAHAG